MLSHHDVISRFYDHKEKTRYGYATGANVFADEDAIYSYGRHFPLAIRREGKSNLKDGKEWYLLNGDKYSVSTNQHQSKTFRIFQDYPRVAFSALKAAGIYPRLCELIDFRQDEYKFCTPVEKEFEDFKSTVPYGAEYHENTEEGKVTQKWYHKIGAVLLKQEEKYYICGMDEGSYFICLLPSPAYTIDEAFDTLKPKEVLEAQIAKVDIKRQGEWFFIPDYFIPPTIKEKDFLKSADLPREDDNSSFHVVTRMYVAAIDYWVKGWVRHKNRWTRLKGDHKAINLGDKLHLAVRNAAVASWSAGGKVD